MALAYIPTLLIDISTTGGAGSHPTAATWVAVDVEDYVLSARFEHGAKHFSHTIATSSLSLSLLNTDAAFTPTNTSSPYYGALRLGAPIRIRASWAGTTYNLWHGFITDITLDYDTSATSKRATIEAVDIVGVWATQILSTYYYAHDSASALASSIIQHTLGLGGYCTIYAEDPPVQDLPIQAIQADTFVFDVLKTLCNTANAMILSQPSFWKTLGVVYINSGRLASYTSIYLKPENVPTPEYVAPYHRISPFSMHKKDVVNDIRVSRVGGTEQHVTDTTSKTTYGELSMSASGLLLRTDADALSLANYYLSTRKDHYFGFDWVEVDLGKVDSSRRTLAVDRLLGNALSVGTQCRVWHNSVEYDMVVLGTTHTISSTNAWVVRLHLSPTRYHTYV